ncbi:MAG: hypothetical protein JW729_07050 [Bacteroidales bacterium]|nr:hypothetical protein [Bacteroidales bacterium]
MKSFLLILSILIMNSCSSAKKNKITAEAKKADTDQVILNFKDGPQTIIYKTKQNFDKNVPVTLSEDKTKIVAYPNPKDVIIHGELTYPTKLINGYLLDNKGITERTAFLSFSYQEYSQLEKAPSLDELFASIIEKDPFLELYNCGNRFTFKNGISDINKLVEKNVLKDCKCLKKE